MRSVLFFFLAAAIFSPAFAQDAPGVASSKNSSAATEARKGWFWYVDPKEEKPKPIVDPILVEVKPLSVPDEKEKKVVIGIGDRAVIAENTPFIDPCLQIATWGASCGFIDPGEDFEFQSKQRDVLLRQMSMRPDSPESVEAAQRYMKWVVGKASQAANMWYYNLIQKPELDPRVKSPISELGIALASRVTTASQIEYFKLMRDQGGLLFYFTRNDCVFCHDQTPNTIRVARSMGLRLINVPLDGKCVEGFAPEDCAGEITPEQMSVVDLNIVPTLYLFVPSNTWLRLNTGVTTDSSTIANAVNFFSAYRAALIQGVDNGDGVRPSVSFNPNYTGAATGVTSADGTPHANLPSQARMMELMGMAKKLKETNAAVSATAAAFTQAQNK